MGQVLVVGAGPVGLSLALDLARQGVRCRVIDKAPSPSPYCRAIGVTPRSLEVFETLGVARVLIDAGLWLRGMRSIISGHQPQDTPMPDLGLPYAALGVPQYETERVLAEALATHGVIPERGIALVEVSQDADGVDVTFADEDGKLVRSRFAFVVGCDGAHSQVRRAIGASFDGDAYPWSFMLGDVHIDWDLAYGMTLRALRPKADAPPDLFVAIPLPERGRYRVTMLAPPSQSGGESAHGIQAEMPGPSLAELQPVADDLVPGKPQLSDLRWSSIFRISMRLASRYRDRRVLIAGDAAHIHPPTGGQGMNTGIQDAHNLAWKLALVVKEQASEKLLDSYEAERRPEGAAVIARTRAASESLGRKPAGGPDERLVDAQVLVNYRGGPIVIDSAGPETEGPQAGDRAPDVVGLKQSGLRYLIRLFNLFDRTGHTLLVLDDDPVSLDALEEAARYWSATMPGGLRVVAFVEGYPEQRAGLTVIGDSLTDIRQAFGKAGAVAIRPDGHIGWRGESWRDPGFAHYAARIKGGTQDV